MRGAFFLFTYTLRRVRTPVLATGGLLALFQVVLILVAGSIQRNGTFEQLGLLFPPFLRELLGPSFVAFLSFAGIVSVGYFHVAVMGAVISLPLALATIPTSEIETGFLELVLSRPVARHWIVTRTIVVTVVATVLVLTAMVGATWTALRTMAPRDASLPSLNLILSLAANLGALMLCWAGVAMAIGCGSRRRGLAAGAAGWLALAAFLLDYVGRLWKPAEKVAWLSPFRYYSPLEMVMGGPLPGNDLAVLGGTAALGFVAAYVLFARRDLQR
jgi:ABC-2 type transport system permease protein